MKKKFLLFCCSIALVLSACGGGSSSNNTEANTTEAVEEKTEEVAEAQNETETVAESNDAAAPQDPEEVVATREITEEDVLGRWVFTTTKDVLELKKGGEWDLYEYGFPYPTSSGYSIEGNEVVMVGFNPSYDSDHRLQYDDSGSQRKLLSDKGDFIYEDDFYNEQETFSMGDTLSTNSVEVVINSLGFTDGSELKNIISGSIANNIDNGQTYAHINFDVTNMSKQELLLPEKVDFTLDYNSGFMFSTNSQQDSFLYKPSNGESCSIHSGGGTNWSMAAMGPLDSQSFDLFIPFAEKAATDGDAVYTIHVVMPGDNGIQEFTVAVD